MAGSAPAAPVRQPRRGPAPIASFDHDVSEESSPETKQASRLPEIREDSLAPPEPRARSLSSPAAALAAPPAPRIDISRASSSSHHDSRDSSPELALFAGAAPGGELGFREDGALDLRSSTEELAFLEPAPGERPPAPAARRPSRRDSQGSEAALLAVSGRTSRLSSVGSQCSAHSALSAYSHTSRVSHLSVASGASRSPSPHRMLLETSFCGPKPIETDPDICGAAVEERLLEMAKLNSDVKPSIVTVPSAPTPVPIPIPIPVPIPIPAIVSVPVDARDRREVRTEATVERATPRPPSTKPPAPSPSPAPAPAIEPAKPAITPATVTVTIPLDDDKREKETKNRVRAEERRARSRERRDSGDSRIKSRSKDIIRIRLKPDSEYGDDDDDDVAECAPASSAALKPVTLELSARPTRPTELAAENGAPTVAHRKPSRDSRTPSPAGVVVSRKSSFCSLFKSRETIASPESPSDALRRKKSVNEGRSRSRSRDRSATPTSATKIKGSMLSLFKTPRKSATSPSPSSRDGSPVVQPQLPQQPVRPPTRAEKLKYYEDAKDGIIHIPLRTPPDDGSTAGTSSGAAADTRPASAPQQRAPPSPIAKYAATTPVASSTASNGHASMPSTSQIAGVRSPSKPIQRTVLPDGSIIIPLRSPTEKEPVEDSPLASVPVVEERRPPELKRPLSAVETSSITSQEPISVTSGPISISPADTGGVSTVDVTPSPDPAPPPPMAESSKRRERLMFTTHVGSAEQVFCTQFSITKTPSVTSEISGSFPSFLEIEAPPREAEPVLEIATVIESNGVSPQDEQEVQDTAEATRDSSESEASSEAGPARGGNDVERRGLVVQESFEDELPYVPTTLPQERSLALPMVPVRERADVRVTRLERPRAHAPSRAQPVPQVPNQQDLPQERSLALPMVPVRERADVRVTRLERPRAHAPSRAQPVPQVPNQQDLPQERSLALPMVPVRERADVRVTRLERPRAHAPSRAQPVPQVPNQQDLPQERSLALPMVPVRERADVRVTRLERPRAHAPSRAQPVPQVPNQQDLPQERSLALPMVPVRERADVRVTRLERPRAHAPSRAQPVPQVPPAPPPTPAPRMSATEEKIRIRLPRRPRTASASAPPARPERPRARSGSDGMETKPKSEWIDFEELPERRKQPKRIQTLPSATLGAAGSRDVVFSYVEPDECRCECHARADDETPLLLTHMDQRLVASPVDCGLELSVQLGRPFTSDLQLSHEATTPQESTSGAGAAGRH